MKQPKTGAATQLIVLTEGAQSCHRWKMCNKTERGKSGVLRLD